MKPQLGLIGLVVSDMGASLAFYRRLGLDIPADADTESHVEAALPGGLHLGFDTTDVVRSIVSDWVAPSGGHRIALAFACDTPAGVDAVYADLTGAGHHGHKAPWDAFWGQRYAIVHDPDGNTIELFAPLNSASGH